MRSNRTTPLENQARPLTTQRQLLLDVLRQAKGHLDAKEIFRRASERDAGISLATVYRNLRLFKGLGLVEERRLEKAGCSYEIRGTREHHHLVCTACGRVIEFESPLVEKLLAEVQDKTRFDVARVSMYLEGHCRECKDKEETGPS